ncbi:MAG: hypothetical protein ACXVHW_05660 [Methanobacterium sp.]
MIFETEKEKYVLYFNSGKINKSCEISKERAIEYMVLCDKDLICELNLDNEVSKFLLGNEVLNVIYNGEYGTII